MPQRDRINNKKILAVGVNCVPLPTGAQIVMKARVDSTGAWTTIFTKTATSPDTALTSYETPITSTMAIPDGQNLEFRLESTGGAQITGFSYKYQSKVTNLS